MCDQWKTDSAMLSQELSTEQWFSVIDSASRMHAAVIVITGGEPLLREDIFDIIRYIRKRGIACHVCTNGTLINEATVKRLKNSRLNSISISLDSECAEIHNQMRGVNCFETVIKGIQLLRQIAPELKIGINCVISKLNFRGIYRMVYFAENLGVNQIKLDAIHTNLMHRRKSLSSFDGLLFNKEDLLELKFEINRLMRAISQAKLLTTSSTFMRGLLDFFEGRQHRLRCYAGYISCAIDALGNVSPCDNFDSKENLRDKPLEEIWKSQASQQLRNLVENCNSQCWDTTHTELNIRCSNWGFLREFSQILKEMCFYLRLD